MRQSSSGIIAIILVALSLFGLYVFSVLFMPPKFVKIKIQGGEETASISEPITMTFSNRISDKIKRNFSITSSNLKVKGDLAVKGNSLTFKPDDDYPLAPGTEYTVKVTETSFLGIKGKTHRFIIITEPLQEDALPDNLKEDLINNTDQLEEGKIPGHEIIRYLPYKDQYFEMRYEPQEKDGSVKYYVTLFGNKAVSKDRFRTWLKAKGAQENKLTIIYE